MLAFPTLEETLELHKALIHRFGGQSGLRDKGLLMSALYRPQTGYYQSFSEMAAALFESLLTNHPFVDGNKRVAFALTDLFLRMNGFKLSLSCPDEAYDFIIRSCSEPKNRFEKIKNWIEENMVEAYE